MKNKHTSDSNDLQKEKIIKYLKKELPEEDKILFEKELLHDDFLSAAIEGLQYVEEINNLGKLDEKLKYYVKKKTKNKARFKIFPIQFPLWIFILTLLIFIIAIIGIVFVTYLKTHSY